MPSRSPGRAKRNPGWRCGRARPPPWPLRSPGLWIDLAPGAQTGHHRLGREWSRTGHESVTELIQVAGRRGRRNSPKARSSWTNAGGLPSSVPSVEPTTRSRPAPSLGHSDENSGFALCSLRSRGEDRIHRLEAVRPPHCDRRRGRRRRDLRRRGTSFPSTPSARRSRAKSGRSPASIRCCAARSRCRYSRRGR